MNLTTEQILSALKGAPEATVRDGRVIPDRFSAIQQAEYVTRKPQHDRTDCHAAVTMDFDTDASSMTIYYKNTWSESDFPPFFFDVYENGIMTQHLGFAVKRNDYERVPDGQVFIPLSAGEKRVTVYLTNYFHIEISRVTLNDGATFRPHTHKGRFLSFGDSITEGFQATCPSMTYVSTLGRLMDYEAVNYGIGGERLLPELIVPGTYPDCDFVTVAYGTNDLPVTDEETFRRHVTEQHERLHKAFPNIPVFIMTPIFRYAQCAERPAGHLKHYASILAASAGQYDHFHVIDGLTLLPPEKCLYYDKTHPNIGGMTVMALNLKTSLEKYL